jgi:hypothetical protein
MRTAGRSLMRTAALSTALAAALTASAGLPAALAPLPAALAPLPAALAPLPGALAPLPGALAPLPGGTPEAAAATKKHAKRAADGCKKRTRCAQIRRPVRRPAAERLIDLRSGGQEPPAPEQPEPPGPVPGPVPAPPAPPRFVSVAAREYSLTLSRPLVGAGAVTVELRNVGEDPHNLVVSPEGTYTPLATFTELDPGLYERRQVALEPGRYLLWCSLEFHEGLGMRTTLRVQ